MFTRTVSLYFAYRNNDFMFLQNIKFKIFALVLEHVENYSCIIIMPKNKLTFCILIGFIE